MRTQSLRSSMAVICTRRFKPRGASGWRKAVRYLRRFEGSWPSSSSCPRLEVTIGQSLEPKSKAENEARAHDTCWYRIGVLRNTMRDSPRQTALTVALSLLSLSAHPSHKGAVESDYADQLVKLLCASGQMTSIGAWVWRNPWTARGSRRSFDLAGLPGQFAAFGTRKQFFETQARKSIANGAAQVLVLGAGYDLLCQRLGPEFPAACGSGLWLWAAGCGAAANDRGNSQGLLVAG